MLFSEPKIPQYCADCSRRELPHCGFSALQRAENSSIVLATDIIDVVDESFSALQRAENSSILQRLIPTTKDATVSVLFSEPKIPQSVHARIKPDQPQPFQCSSASRKFLNPAFPSPAPARSRVSVLFNEPKLLKCVVTTPARCITRSFSALQRAEIAEMVRIFSRSQNERGSFSALQRAEIAEIPTQRQKRIWGCAFQCSSTSRNC